jgi:hypothetical protein
VAFVVDDLAGVAGRAGSRCWPQETDRVGAGPEHPDPDRPQQPRRLDHGGGDAAAARDQYAALLPIRERVSGPEHPDTLDARASLAEWTRGSGR